MGDYGGSLVEPLSAVSRAEHNTAQRAIPVPDTKVGVSRAGTGQVGDLTAHPDVLEQLLPLQCLFDIRGDLVNSVYGHLTPGTGILRSACRP